MSTEPAAAHLDNVQQTGAIKVSDPGSHALQLYLSALGVVASVDVIGQIMVLIPVLALEIGSALAIVLVQAVAPNRPELRFNQPEQLFAAQNNSPAPKLLTCQRTTRSETEKKIINHLQGYNSNQRVTEHTLADQIGANRSTVHRALASLCAQGMIDVDARGRRGTVIKLRG